MAKITLFTAVVTLAAVLVAVRGQKYSDKFASLDLEKILNDPATYAKYLNCLKGSGECTPEGQALKNVLPEALKTGCAKCSDEQKQKARKVIEFLIEKKPEDYAELEKTYDPSGSARARIQKKSG